MNQTTSNSQSGSNNASAATAGPLKSFKSMILRSPGARKKRQQQSPQDEPGSSEDLKNEELQAHKNKENQAAGDVQEKGEQRKVNNSINTESRNNNKGNVELRESTHGSSSKIKRNKNNSRSWFPYRSNKQFCHFPDLDADCSMSDGRYDDTDDDESTPQAAQADEDDEDTSYRIREVQLSQTSISKMDLQRENADVSQNYMEDDQYVSDPESYLGTEDEDSCKMPGDEDDDTDDDSFGCEFYEDKLKQLEQQIGIVKGPAQEIDETETEIEEMDDLDFQEEVGEDKDQGDDEDESQPMTVTSRRKEGDLSQYSTHTPSTSACTTSPGPVMGTVWVQSPGAGSQVHLELHLSPRTVPDQNQSRNKKEGFTLKSPFGGRRTGAGLFSSAVVSVSPPASPESGGCDGDKEAKAGSTRRSNSATGSSYLSPKSQKSPGRRTSRSKSGSNSKSYPMTPDLMLSSPCSKLDNTITADSGGSKERGIDSPGGHSNGPEQKDESNEADCEVMETSHFLFSSSSSLPNMALPSPSPLPQPDPSPSCTPMIIEEGEDEDNDNVDDGDDHHENGDGDDDDDGKKTEKKKKKKKESSGKSSKSDSPGKSRRRKSLTSSETMLSPKPSSPSHKKKGLSSSSGHLHSSLSSFSSPQKQKNSLSSSYHHSSSSSPHKQKSTLGSSCHVNSSPSHKNSSGSSCHVLSSPSHKNTLGSSCHVQSSSSHTKSSLGSSSHHQHRSPSHKKNSLGKSTHHKSSSSSKSHRHSSKDHSETTRNTEDVDNEE